MKSVRYAVYLGIFLHFLRRCLGKSLTQVRHPTIDLSGEIGGRDSLPESLHPSYNEVAKEIDREILHRMVEEANRRWSAYRLADTIRAGRMAKDIKKRFEDSIEVRSVSATRRGDEIQLNVDCVLGPGSIRGHDGACMKSIRNAIYLAIFLHMARKILRRACTPRPLVRVRTVNGRKVFQLDSERVRAATRKIRASYSEEQMSSMAGYDVEALLTEFLQEEIQGEACKSPSLGKSFDDGGSPIIITQDDIDSGRVRQIFLKQELNAFSRREPGYIP